MDRYSRALLDHLSGFVTENRYSLFRQVVEKRTRYVTLLLEDIYQSQNASAVLRTCDCLGIQDVHIVEQRNEYDINREVALGSDQWLTLNYYREEGDPIHGAVRKLKTKGYRIVATSPHHGGNTPESIDLEQGKIALMFGTELNGLTDQAMALADEFIQISMVGFTESYNISVSAAVILYQIRNRLEQSAINWKLSEPEQSALLLEWLKSSIKMSEQIENQFRREYPPTF
ncbi:MAG: TrmH family RNA methyltransferase [Bacteroidales bacterium]